MGKTLIVAEKPSVAADIAKALGGDFRQVDRNVFERGDVVVTCARGHCVQISIAQEHDKGWEMSALPVIPPEFKLGAIQESASFLKTIRDLVRRDDVSSVVNACDAGREGELIFGLIAAYIGCRKPIKRMWLQSMTHDAIRDAYTNMRPGSERAKLLDAAKCRSEADLLIGFNGTRALTNLYRQRTGGRDVATAGRVQTPVLAIICDREEAIRNFVPRDYWEVHGTFKVGSGSYVGKWQGPQRQREGAEEEKADRLWTEAEALEVSTRCRGVAPTSIRETKEPANSVAPKLFDLTTLQREANKKFGFTATDTLKIAQSLYETHKVLTYPRTDSSALPEDYIHTASQLLTNLAENANNPHAQRVVQNGWVKPDKRIFNNAKISDHFAIIPTMVLPDKLSREEHDIYNMVMQRFVAAFHPPAQYEKTTRWTEIGRDRFLSSGRVLVKEGWLAVYGRQTVDDDEDAPAGLCAYVEGETVANDGMNIVKGRTKAPVRFNEATLLGAMESAGKLVDDEAMREAMAERGLGTPATRASIIEGLVSEQRGYAVRQKKELVPTQKGMEVVSVLRSIGLEALTSPAMTGEWEAKLLHMEQGKVERVSFMRGIEAMARDIVEQIRAKSAATPQREMPKLRAPCPDCGGALSLDHRTAHCVACDYKLWRVIAGKTLDVEQTELLLTARVLPEIKGFKSAAGKSFAAGLKLVDGGRGKVEFVFQPREGDARSGATTAAPRGKPGKSCPQCNGGHLIERRGVRGKFFGCSGYPSCTYTEQAK